jgi:membrane-associated phospholipid phosphatase
MSSDLSAFKLGAEVDMHSVRASSQSAERLHALVTWAAVVAFAAVDTVWLPISGMRLVGAGGWVVASPFIIALFAVPPVLSFRVKNDPSFIATVIAGGAERLRILLYIAISMVGLGVSGIIFSYLSTSLARPLRDNELSMMDRTLGFDWPAFLAWTDSHPLLAHAVISAYHTSGTQLLLLYCFLAFTLQRERAYETVAIQAASSLFVGIGMTLVPASGAYSLYKPLVHNYSPLSGMWHYQTFAALRTSAPPLLDFSHVQGLVTFPSFHTVLALLIPFALRGHKLLFWPTALLNGFVLVGTITEGGHYLTDVIAGASIFAVCALALRTRLYTS